ncbi:hypothetical protein HPB49_016860 [Dermacentor silvarum]|uniref:Uncharacterized protein n=1 Tax=Dermacentor silvarum TaxID=543639 RepID=A0ACB8DET4_DERSI|nr:hypothetical protein HPB49_016860 [Dermacentor silvarum]
MDAVHEPEFRPWIGETMSPADFKRKWTDALKNEQHDEEQNVREAIMQLMNIPESVLKTLEADCKLQRQDLEKRENDEAYRLKTCHYFRKVCFLSLVNCTKHKTQQKFPEEECVPSNEVVLIVQVFRPIIMPLGMKKVRMGAHNFPFKASVSLFQFCFYLLHALMLNLQRSSSNFILTPLQELYKSGFFYIGNTFYNDMSDPSCRDYSEVIIEWAKDPHREIGPFKTADMEKTKLADLELRLGYPYVYVHQGYCEHLVVFSDMRVLHPHDSQHRLDYPMALKSFSFGRRVFCMLCHQSTAK